ncbi:ankyrin repeat protein [Rutstroemia sp. NJR-2017a BBW]|nr:ankyrin repeat protein [Rutstroemia sp. NJR-2017a BBW]
MDKLARQVSDEEIEKGNKVVRPPKLGSLEGIFDRSIDCLERFRDSIKLLKDTDPSMAVTHGYDLEFSLFTMQDAFAHFRAWGNNIAAFQHGTLRSSLQFRLKEASEIRQRILKILGNLQVSLYEATLIISGKELNEHWPIEEFSDEDEDEGLDVESEQTSELQELFKAMEDANSNLMKLSMVIRTSPNHDDYLKAATRYKFDSSYDIGHVREKHGLAKGMSEWLIIRLGKAITRRRQFLKYREDHHGKLTRDWDQMAVDTEDKTIALTKATTFVENAAPMQKDGTELENSFGSETSYDATIVGESTGKLSVPSHPKMAFEGVPFEFDKPFQCPYCFTEQVVKNRSAWKKHVFRDLRPYVCTFKECDMRMFRSRNEWFSHELQNHRREWACQQCQHAPFSSSSEYEGHLRANHHIELQGSQLKALLLQSEEPVDKVAAAACRLCNDWETNIEDPKHDSNRSFLHGGQSTQPYGTRNQFRRHLGRHMEQLALFALPMAEDTMEDDSLSEEDDVEQAVISVNNEASMNNPIAEKVPGPASLDEAFSAFSTFPPIQNLLDDVESSTVPSPTSASDNESDFEDPNLAPPNDNIDLVASRNYRKSLNLLLYSFANI